MVSVSVIVTNRYSVISQMADSVELILSSDILNGAEDVSATGDKFTVSLENPIEVPADATSCEVQCMDAALWFTVPNVDDANRNFRVTGPDTLNVITVYNLQIPKGLYDLTGLSAAILRELSNAGAKQSPLPLLTFLQDDATSKVVLVLNYITVSVDFTIPNNLRFILGFDAGIITPVLPVPFAVLADNVAQFNTLNSFLIHCDIVQSGVRLNSTYSSIVANPYINVSPGSQVLYQPYNPPSSSENQLIGSSISVIRCWVTDEKNRPIDTNGETWYFRIKISYTI